VVRVAATYPSGDPDRTDTGDSRPTLSSAPASRARRSLWVAIAIAGVVVVVVAVVAYMLLYNGGTPSYGGGGAGGGGMNDGGGYFVLAFTGDAVRRVVNKLKR
jgi:hypothetical protein